MKYKLLLYTLILASSLTGTHLSFAELQPNFTRLGIIKPNQELFLDLELQKGKNVIELMSDDPNAIFTCKFLDPDGSLIAEQINFQNCKGLFKLISNKKLMLKFKNETNKLIDYELRYQYVKTKK